MANGPMRARQPAGTRATVAGGGYIPHVGAQASDVSWSRVTDSALKEQEHDSHCGSGVSQNTEETAAEQTLECVFFVRNTSPPLP
uniref:Uncharacterized protein n=1 Tax=Knipowitschia caucasica TaxID=637954 RepID=A0AAV2JL23_KNICA